MTLRHFHMQANTVNTDILKDDAITFSVLISILQGMCNDVYTDGENIVICYSNPPYPVWVWCRDIEEGHIREICECLKENFPIEKGFCYDLEEKLLERLKIKDQYFNDAEILYGLLSYRLDKLNDIPPALDGHMEIAEEKDTEYLIKLWKDFEYEAEGIEFDDELCRKTIMERIADKKLFVWVNNQGQITAMASRWGGDENYCKIASVYTLPEFRRKGYALNLVHGICKEIISDGLTPILYTDEGYYASNECYKKIGFYKVGNLVKAGKEE